MGTSSRNYSIDLLRICSMLGVVLLHVLSHGGFITSALSPAKFSIIWFLEILAFPAVNCFVLISGYVGYKNEKFVPKIKNIISLWFTVLFYSVIIFVVFKIFGPEPLGATELLKSFMPTIMDKYWFFTAYFGLFLLSPILNFFVYKSNLRQVFIFFIVFSLFILISLIRDVFSMSGGYSVMWLVFMYLIGAIIKKYNFSQLFSKKIWLIIILSSFLVTYFSKIILYFTNISFLKSHSGELVSYVSPTIVLMSIGLLCLLVKTKCPTVLNKWISLFSSSAFSVYLIHDNPYVRKYIISHIYDLINSFNVMLLVLLIFCLVIIIFVSCTLIDKIRIWLFNIFKINKFAELIENFIKTKISIIYIKYVKTSNKLQSTEE